MAKSLTSILIAITFKFHLNIKIKSNVKISLAKFFKIPIHWRCSNFCNQDDYCFINEQKQLKDGVTLGERIGMMIRFQVILRSQ